MVACHMSIATRRSLRTGTGRRAAEIRRAIGREVAELRSDAGISQRALAAAAGIPQSFLSKIERGTVEASTAVLVAIAEVLGADLRIRLFPTTGPRIRDPLQAAIVEALLREAHPSWKRLVEVPVWRPARGVIDVVFAHPGDVVVATEVHSEIRRLEQQLRWGREKAEAVPSAVAWSMLSDGSQATRISQLLVLRNTRSNREAARAFEATLRAAYPAHTSDAIRALRDGGGWPGAAIVWADVRHGGAQLNAAPPRGVRLGR